MHTLTPKQLCSFFAEYAATMLGCGATCSRIVRNLNRMAHVAGAKVDVITLPSHTLVTLTPKGSDESVSHSVGIKQIPVSFLQNTLLSALSWKVHDRKLTLSQAEREFKMISHTKPYGAWKVMLLVVLANASFCRLFSGDWGAMFLVAIATLAGYSLKIVLLEKRFDVKLMALACSFVSAIIGALGFRLPELTATPDVALGTSILYLIPGIPYINSVSDFLAGHNLCGLSRLCHAALLTCCIALGLTAAFMVMDIKILS